MKKLSEMLFTTCFKILVEQSIWFIEQKFQKEVSNYLLYFITLDKEFPTLDNFSFSYTKTMTLYLIIG